MDTLIINLGNVGDINLVPKEEALAYARQNGWQSQVKYVLRADVSPEEAISCAEEFDDVCVRNAVHGRPDVGKYFLQLSFNMSFHLAEKAGHLKVTLREMLRVRAERYLRDLLKDTKNTPEKVIFHVRELECKEVWEIALEIGDIKNFLSKLSASEKVLFGYEINSPYLWFFLRRWDDIRFFLRV